jgi:hypothetical protein
VRLRLKLHKMVWGGIDRDRYCPSIEHVNLLLTLLSTDPRSLGKDAHILRNTPDIIILWDIARLLMEDVTGDENLPPGMQEEGSKKGEMRFKSG